MISVREVANYMLHRDAMNEGDGLSNLKLQKLVYYAQGFHLAIFDQPLFEERIEAWTHGPVTPELYQQYKSFGKNPIPLAGDSGLKQCVFSDNQRELLDEVFEVFGQYSAWKLRDMTHEESPWLNNESHAGVISPDEIKEYFKTRIQ
ncbi:MAG: hypothetical protein CMI12_09215 [Oceanospirillum sp.]|nr:hypothetical protein [Oceanospirillum sp.]